MTQTTSEPFEPRTIFDALLVLYQLGVESTMTYQQPVEGFVDYACKIFLNKPGKRDSLADLIYGAGAEHEEAFNNLMRNWYKSTDPEWLELRSKFAQANYRPMRIRF